VSIRPVRVDNRLSLLDQAAFLSMRATGLGQLMQAVWVYEHAVDMDALRRFHHDLGYGLLGRRIERSSLPFGRHRWVSSLGPPSDIDIAEFARPRVELSDWIDERTQIPIDPEAEPGWHLGLLPLTDGSTAISLVISHCLADGLGALLTIAEAAKGNPRDLGYPPPRSRTRLEAVASDARQIAMGAPEMARALVAVARIAVRRRHDLARATALHSTASHEDGDRAVVVPVVTAFIDADDWDARAEALGGTGYSLFAGFAAKLGEHMGRLRAEDGSVTLLIPISDRTEDDTRANAMPFATVDVDPTQVTVDLSGARVAVREAVNTLRDAPDETLQVLPLIQLVPDRVVHRLADVYLGTADLPVSCSNLGHVDPAVARPDGTDAEYVILRGLNQCVSRQALEQARGQLSLVCGSIGGKLSISVGAYQRGGKNTKVNLRELVARTLAEFGLTGVIC
jgi:hypothetical protein